MHCNYTIKFRFRQYIRRKIYISNIYSCRKYSSFAAIILQQIQIQQKNDSVILRREYHAIRWNLRTRDSNSYARWFCKTFFFRPGARIGAIAKQALQFAEFFIAQLLRHEKRIPPDWVGFFFHGGEREIRTLGTGLPHTRFPVVRLRPAQPSLRADQISILLFFSFCQYLFGIFLKYFFRNEKMGAEWNPLPLYLVIPVRMHPCKADNTVLFRQSAFHGYLSQ